MPNPQDLGIRHQVRRQEKVSIFSTYGISEMSLPRRCRVDGSATAASMVVLI
jgi:hypothetical protein